MAVIRGECDRILAEGIREPSQSPWLSPVVLALKKYREIKFYINFWNLNNFILGNAYAMPRVYQALDDPHNTVVHSTMLSPPNGQ